jgi:hypothetical protein
VKLRHHRGPLFTVPFGVLGAVQNMSRDWVIDKLTIGVSYDSDFDQGEEAHQADRQGTGGGSGIRAQHHRTAQDAGRRSIRRLRHPDPSQDDDPSPASNSSSAAGPCPMIKQAFDENGIRFAVPTVQVAGHEEVGPGPRRIRPSNSSSRLRPRPNEGESSSCASTDRNLTTCTFPLAG